MPGRLRVLLVEDDASLQRFVAMALEDEDVRLQGCISVDEGLIALATQPFDLVITDLMLPGRHGHELLVALRERPELRGQAQLAVFSAGLNAQVRQQLETLGVTRFLSKPVSLGTLQTCVREAAAQRHPPDATAGGSPKPDSSSGSSATAPGSTASVHRTAVDEFFGGNAALYQAFLARCRAQFPQDISLGREAVEQGLYQPLRHLAHSLKSVLQTLGYPAAAALARELEASAHQASQAGPPSHVPADHREAVRTGWAHLEAELTRLL